MFTLLKKLLTEIIEGIVEGVRLGLVGDAQDDDQSVRLSTEGFQYHRRTVFDDPFDDPFDYDR
ncbi:hypothetical protein [Hahella ganghwensis]|uniref:hypothetical protein n=1 Tax=Hahella ganghwensis TaxID=286420 RepID=UPI000362FE6D|nr:hypothetical protein [Hahella ganghwensis]